MRIVLIGFMGSGKSSIAKALSKKLSWPVLELDQILLESNNLESMNYLVETFGEEHFRNLESKVVLRVSTENNCIISTGGGCIMRNENYLNLRSKNPENTTFVFLDTSFEVIQERLKHDTNRPLFKDKTKALSLYNSRLEVYKKAANIIISTDTNSIDILAEEILKEINLKL